MTIFKCLRALKFCHLLMKISLANAFEKLYFMKLRISPFTMKYEYPQPSLLIITHVSKINWTSRYSMLMYSEWRLVILVLVAVADCCSCQRQPQPAAEIWMRGQTWTFGFQNWFFFNQNFLHLDSKICLQNSMT